MNKVTNLKDWSATSAPDSRERLLGNGNDGGDNGGMDYRLDHLEKRVDIIDGRLGRIEGDVTTLSTDVGAIKTSLVTFEGKLTTAVEALRGDIARAISENHKWTHTAMLGMFSTFVLGVLGLLFTIWSTSKATAPPTLPQQPPIIITIPSSSVAPVMPAPIAPQTVPAPAPVAPQQPAAK